MFFVLLGIIGTVIVYVQIINKNTQSMTGRQKALKAFYPVWMAYSKFTRKASGVLSNEQNTVAPQSFYLLKATLNNGQILDFSTLKGKNVLIVNTASDCGYTNQYEALQQIFERYEQKLVVIGFPANDFKEQEKGSDEDIARFCKVNFGVNFPLAKKSSVIKTKDQNPVFEWLSDKDKNGWNDREPTWNFAKYLIDEQGRLMNYFAPSVSPADSSIIRALR